MIGAVYMAMILISIGLCILIVTCRINCNRCGADMRSIKSLKGAQKCALITFIFGVILFAVDCLVIGLYSTYTL